MEHSYLQCHKSSNGVYLLTMPQVLILHIKAPVNISIPCEVVILQYGSLQAAVHITSDISHGV